MLSLIPAKYYYDDATQNQWQLKKKSKKDLLESKRAKFDPEGDLQSAKDVMDSKGSKAEKISLPGQRASEVQEDLQEDDTSQEDLQEDDISQEDLQEDSSDNSDNEIPSLSAERPLILEDPKEDKKDKEVKQVLPKKTKPALSPEEQKLKDEKLAKLRDKLSANIGQLREKRKAPGTKLAGAPKSRDQILAQRKKKDELKKQEKLKRKAAEMEEEEEDSESEAETEETEDVLYGNIVFQDGSRVTSDLTKLRNTAEKKKQKGPANNDIKAHLKKLEEKKRKLSSLSEEDQEKFKEKEKWSRMMNAAEGVKVKDDEKLLKKALKRKDRQKLKSEVEWKERKQVVKDTVAARAKRSQDNLKARRENKGKKGKDQVRLKKFTGNVNKNAKSKKRAGFEGSAKTKVEKNDKQNGRGRSRD